MNGVLPPVIFLMGPTAAGKTALALEISDHFPTEIISVDSALIYRGMDIGTAKPTPDILSKYPHHLVDILEPTQSYSAGQFRADALRLISDIHKRGKIPLLIGGTMLYFKALQQGLADLPDADPEIRQHLDDLVAEKGLVHLHVLLSEVDPDSARRIHINDPQRLQRALEIYYASGQTMTALLASQNSHFDYPTIKMIVAPFNRKILHKRIEMRYREMVNDGFLDEVRALQARGDCHSNLPSIRAIGYRQAWSYLMGDISLDTCIEQAIIATRQMAKRQLTWARAQNDAVWFNSDEDLPTDAVFDYLKWSLAEAFR